MGLFNRKKAEPKENFSDFPPIGGLMVSRMVTDQNIKPRFMYREKPTRPEDSGWRIFTGFESAEFNENADNIGIYNPSTILQIDPSIYDILLKGIGSVYEKNADGTAWYPVTDFDLEDDYMVKRQLTDKSALEINNLFIRTVEDNGDLLFTTGDKSVRLTIFEQPDKNRAQLVEEYQNTAKNRDQAVAKTLELFDLSDRDVSRIGYRIKEGDGNKQYDVIYGFTITDGEVLMTAFYFDDEKDKDWAIGTWESITTEAGGE